MTDQEKFLVSEINRLKEEISELEEKLKFELETNMALIDCIKDLKEQLKQYE